MRCNGAAVDDDVGTANETRMGESELKPPVEA